MLRQRATTRVVPTNDAVVNVDIDKTPGNIIGTFKSITTVEYIRGVKNSDWPSFRGKLWQRNYYEHINATEQAYLNISEYIIENPARLKDDKFYVK